jgi:hypothetical protein
VVQLTHEMVIHVSSRPQFRIITPREYKRANTNIDAITKGVMQPARIEGARVAATYAAVGAGSCTLFIYVS